MSDATNEVVYANGVDATGAYLLPPMAPAEIAALARGEEADDGVLAALTKATAATDSHLGLPFDVDPANLTGGLGRRVLDRGGSAGEDRSNT